MALQSCTGTNPSIITSKVARAPFLGHVPRFVVHEKKTQKTTKTALSEGAVCLTWKEHTWEIL